MMNNGLAILILDTPELGECVVQRAYYTRMECLHTTCGGIFGKVT